MVLPHCSPFEFARSLCRRLILTACHHHQTNDWNCLPTRMLLLMGNPKARVDYSQTANNVIILLLTNYIITCGRTEMAHSERIFGKVFFIKTDKM